MLGERFRPVDTWVGGSGHNVRAVRPERAMGWHWQTASAVCLFAVFTNKYKVSAADAAKLIERHRQGQRYINGMPNAGVV